MLGREIGISGVLTKTCEKCDGNGQIEEKREATIDELSDAQVKTLLHAEIHRESGGEEAKKQKKEARKMKNRGAGGPGNASPRPTNNAGRSALSNSP